ncbi:piwi domain-containing protein [Ditylenchus destructor]|nr:piwi domain-containing protein [Ditylenchus destructor]
MTAQFGSEFSSLRIGTQIEKEAEDILRAEGIAPQVPIVDEKKLQPQTGDVPLTTNVYGVMCKQSEVYQYDVIISSVMKYNDGTEKKREFTKKDKNDAVVADRRDRCRDVFTYLQCKEKQFFAVAGCVYYDLQSIMYTLAQLNVETGPTGQVFKFAGSDIGPTWAHFASIEVQIRRVSDTNSISLGDFGALTRDLSHTDRSLAQFLDIATSQKLMLAKNDHITYSASTSFLLEPQKAGFLPTDEGYFQDNGSYLGIGMQKSVRFVEGPAKLRGRNAALVVETKKTPFHIPETVLEKAKRMVRDVHTLRDNDISKLSKFFSGLQVETKHLGRPQRFIVKGLENTSARDKMFEANGSMISVEAYFMQKHNLKLVEPTLPLVKARGKDGKFSYFPMEVCTVSDSQRVKTQQQTPRQVQEMIKKCAVAPSVLKVHNDKTFNSLQVKNDFLQKAGVTVVDHPLNISGRSIPPPELQFGRNAVSRINPNNYTWNGREFLIPSGCKKWAAFALLTPRDRLNEPDFAKFLERFANDANGRGMQIPRVAHHEVLGSNMKNLHDRVEKAKNNGCDFVLVVHPDAADDIHGGLKLFELEFTIVTQAIRFGTLMNMIQKGQPMTLSNIVNKTNVKLGGLNYSLSINSPDTREVLGSDTLYIGFGINHPGGGLGMVNDSGSSAGDLDSNKPAAPSIVGYSANVGLEHSFEFIGDFVCQQPLRDEKVEVIRQIVSRCLEKYRANRKSEPKRIFIYRNGASEGQFGAILKYELPLVKMALEKARCSAAVNIIVSNKLQSIRFFAKDIDTRARPADQNIKPGLVVDHSIVHPIFTEFFLNSHRALQGTARTPKYTVLLNESGLHIEQFERITYQLCYGHQIVYMPTSLPSPVYIGNRYAERGRKLYQRWIEHPSSTGFQNNYALMTEKLGYYGHAELENRRINA